MTEMQIASLEQIQQHITLCWNNIQLNKTKYIHNFFFTQIYSGSKKMETICEDLVLYHHKGKKKTKL